MDFFEASEIQATCALCHTVGFGVLFLRSNLLRTYQKSLSASFFFPAQTLITPKLFGRYSGKVHTGYKKWAFLLQFWNKLGEYKNFGVQIIQKFLILTEK